MSGRVVIVVVFASDGTIFSLARFQGIAVHRTAIFRTIF